MSGKSSVARRRAATAIAATAVSGLALAVPLAGSASAATGTPAVSAGTPQDAAVQADATSPLSITTTSLPDAMAGLYYGQQQLTAAGGAGPYTWEATGLPAGLTLSASGMLSGMLPATTAPGTYDFTVQAADAESPAQTAQQQLTLTVDPQPPLVITTTSLPAATAGTAYSQQLTAAGLGSFVWSATGLPAGMTLSASGLLSGAPAAPGTYDITITLSGGLSAPQSVQQQLTLTVDVASLSITTSSLPAATAGVGYGQQLAAAGGVGSYSWEAAGLPAGLTLDASGQLGGTPAAAGTYDFTVTAADAESPAQTAQQQLTLTVDPQPPVVITTTSLPAYTQDAGYSQQLTATGGTGTYAWTLASGSTLPEGLALSTSGLLSEENPGAPAPGAYDFTVQAESGGQTVQQQLTLTVDPSLPLVITPSSLPAATAGAAYSQQLTVATAAGVDLSIDDLRWTITGLPAGVTLGEGWLLSGTPAAPGTYDVTITEIIPEEAPQSGQLTLTVNPAPPVITTTSLPAAAAGTAYSQQLRTIGGTGPYTWALVSGTLPEGLTLSAGGLISGTPAGAGGGSSSISVQATDSTGATAVAQVSLAGNPAPALSITTSSLPAATAGVGYGQQLAAAGGVGSYSWEAAGLPAGLTLDASGQLGGTPAAAGTYDFTVTAADAESPAQTAQQQLTLTVDPQPPVVITTTSLPAYTQDAGYSQQLTATGGTGTYAWTLASGSTLPEGLALSTSGLLSEENPGSAGTGAYDFTVQAESGGQTVQQQLTLTVDPSLPLVITPSSLPAATAGAAYSQQLTVATAAGVDLSIDDLRWTITGLPAGVTLGEGWLLSGTPAAPGTYDVTITEIIPEEAPQSGQLTLTVNPAPPVITTTSLPAAAAGTAYSQQLRTIGGTGPYTWALVSGTLPEGLTLSAGGLISGTPAGAGGGSSSISVQATDSTGATAVAQVSLAGNPAPALSITTSSLPAATAGVGYGQQLAAAGGVGSYSWEAAGLPAGLTLDASGQLGGTPAAAGTYDFTVTAADAESPAQTAQQQLTLTVDPQPPVVITTTSLPAYTQDAGYSQQLTATGGTGTYAWTLASGSTLPEGLALSTSGLLSEENPGAPAPGAYDFTVQAESGGQTVQQQLTLTVDPSLPLVITPSSLPAATAGAAYSQQLTVATAAGVDLSIDDLRWTITGLPAGVTLGEGWLLSGTPAAPGTYDVTITEIIPEEAPQSGQLTLTVNPAPPVITTTSLPAAAAGTAYSQQLRTIGGTGPYTWALVSGTLPEGLTLSAGGLLSGTPTTPGTYSVTVQVADGESPAQTVPQQLALTVNPAPLSITTASLPAATAGTAYSQQLAAAGGIGPYTWTSGALPAGLTLSAGGLLSGTPTTPGTYSVTVQVADGESPAQTVQQQLALTVNTAPLVITTTSLPATTVHSVYGQQLTATGGVGPYTWTLASGALPAGLTLSASGVLGGPGGAATPGTYGITVQAADAESPAQTAQRQLTLTVNPEPPVVITTSSLPAVTVGAAYSQQLTAAGGAGSDFSWGVTGLPAGMRVSEYGLLSGTPTTPGTYDLTVTAADEYGDQSVPQQLTLTVNPLPLVITTSSLPAATAGAAYSQQLRTIGGIGPYTWTLASGTLPEGLALSASGLISGTPTGASGGSSSISVQVTDSTGATAVAQLALTGNPAPVVITTSSLPATTVHSVYGQQLTATGGVGPYTWTLASGALPAGLTLSASGVLGGPGGAATPGTYGITVQAADAESPAQTAQRQLTLTVNPEPPVVITTSSLPAVTVGAAYSQQLTAAGGAGSDFSWGVTGLPAGMRVSEYGLLSGTPTTPGTYSVTVTAADEYGDQSVPQQLTLTVNPLPLVITTSSLPAATAGAAYSQQLRTIGGIGPYTWTSGALPAGLTLSAGGLLSGTPTTPGTYSVTVQVADGESPAQTVPQQLALTVNAAPLSITTSSLSAATAGTVYSQQLAAAGGTGPYTWSLASGRLPAGLTLSPSGTISGTPASSGTSIFTVQAADAENPAQTARQQLTLTVSPAPPLVITTTSLPAASVDRAYGERLAAVGGAGAYTWTLAAGTLPKGLTLSTRGLLSGTPASSGTSIFTVQAADGESPAQTARQQFTLTVHAAPLAITTRSLPNAVADRAYSQQLRAAGGVGPYSWSLASGRLPAGITLSREGAIHGEPWAAGTYAFTVRATDSAWPAKSVTERLSITVLGEKADLAVSVTGPSSAEAGSRVTYTVTVKDNGPAWASMVSVSLGTAGLTDVRASDAGRVKLAESRDVAQASAAWYAAGLAPGQTLTFTVTGTVPAEGLKDVSAAGQVQSPTSDPDPRNNTSTVTTKVR